MCHLCDLRAKAARLSRQTDEWRVYLEHIESIREGLRKAHAGPEQAPTEERNAPSAQGVDATLGERGSRYGSFAGHAHIAQSIKRAMRDSPNWSGLSDDKKEALEMVAHKIGRILNGDPEYVDSWHDIIGYTRLVEKILKGEGV